MSPPDFGPRPVSYPEYMPFPERTQGRRGRSRRLVLDTARKIDNGLVRATVADRKTEMTLDIGYAIYGSGPVTVFFNHGTPGSKEDERAKHPPKGVRVVAYDRGGIGRSTPFDRIVADEATILEALLEAEEIEGPVSVFGISGGVPRALAQWALVPQVVNGALVSGYAPPDANTGAISPENWMESNVKAYGAKSKPELDDLWRSFEDDARRIQDDEEVILRKILPQLSEQDRRILSENKELRRQVTSAHVAGSRSGPAGRFEDVVSTGEDWGLVRDPRLVIKPLFPYYGEYDVVTPVEHSRWYKSFGSWRTGYTPGISYRGHFRPVSSISKLFERLRISSEHLANVRVQEVPLEEHQVASHRVQFQDPYKDEYIVTTSKDDTYDLVGRDRFLTTVNLRTTRKITVKDSPRTWLDIGEEITERELHKVPTYDRYYAGEMHKKAIEVSRCELAGSAEFGALMNAGFFSGISD